jgi:hypothetical protein
MAIHWLRYNLCCDEADIDGMAFEPTECGQFVKVYETYEPHYQYRATVEIMTVEKARALWKKATTEDDGFGGFVFTPRPGGVTEEEFWRQA